MKSYINQTKNYSTLKNKIGNDSVANVFLQQKKGRPKSALFQFMNVKILIGFFLLLGNGR